MDEYRMLACAVIKQAVDDARQSCTNKYDTKEREDAVDFIRTKRLENYITWTQLDLNPCAVRKSIQDVRFVTTKRRWR